MSDSEIAIRCLDLTALRGDETEDEIAALCERAARSGVAAVVVYPEHVPTARKRLHGTRVRVATVAGDFPQATASLDERLFDLRRAVDAGPDEIDVVIDRRLVLGGELDRLRDEVAMFREIAGALPMKVIVETAELGTNERIRAVALKVSGGLRTAEQALAYVDLVRDELGEDWLTPGLFRIGASTLLDDLLTR